MGCGVLVLASALVAYGTNEGLATQISIIVKQSK